jgi:hypothetical protein
MIWSPVHGHQRSESWLCRFLTEVQIPTMDYRVEHLFADRS